MIAHINHTIPNIIRLNSICNIHEFSIHDTITESRKEAHDFWEFLYLKTGRLNVLVDGELYTLSAGDSFVGAFCVAVCKGMKAKEAMDFANCTAALTVTKTGAQPSL